MCRTQAAQRSSQVFLSLIAACVSVLTACHSRPSVARQHPAALLGSASAASATPAPRDEPFLTEADAVDKVKTLPEVAELRENDFTAAHPEGLGRKVRPIVIVNPSVGGECVAEGCLYTIDVIDESERGATEPALRFHVDARTGALTIQVDTPYHPGAMSYTAYRELETERRAIEKRLFALAEVKALQKELARLKAVPPCEKPYVGLIASSAPTLGCARGPGCCWEYEGFTMNGCSAHRVAGFEVDSPTGEMRVDGLDDPDPVPYEKWRGKRLQ